jgi:cruciform cutting endonuclease 1
MAIKIPSTLKLAHLKSLAFQCGISSSGTKTILTNRLINEISPILPSKSSGKSPPTRILSIDMGIRNLAYCLLDLPVDYNSPSKSGSQLPSIAEWRRIAVSSAPLPELSADGLTVVPAAKELFDPPTLSTIAYKLLRHQLLTYNPTHILIERQRFRSMGSPHILEWTVRVNMFESMLYAILETLRSEKLWKGVAVPISPGKVGPFWIDPNGLEVALEPLVRADGTLGAPQGRLRKLRNTKNAKILNKGAKIDLVKKWLEAKEMVDVGTTAAENTAKAYLEKWHRMPGRQKGKVQVKVGKAEEMEEMGKLDDLADSLLQGMAWVKWEENKRRVLKDGVEALDLG